MKACEAHVEGVCWGTGSMMHHIVSRARGVGWEGLNDPENLLLVCSACHQWIHDHPKLASERGWLKSRPRDAA